MVVIGVLGWPGLYTVSSQRFLAVAMSVGVTDSSARRRMAASSGRLW
jgi:hypothetical protein